MDTAEYQVLEHTKRDLEQRIRETNNKLSELVSQSFTKDNVFDLLEQFINLNAVGHNKVNTFVWDVIQDKNNKSVTVHINSKNCTKQLITESVGKFYEIETVESTDGHIVVCQYS
jgi:hypothetical protein